VQAHVNSVLLVKLLPKFSRVMMDLQPALHVQKECIMMLLEGRFVYLALQESTLMKMDHRHVQVVNLAVFQIRSCKLLVIIVLVDFSLLVKKMLYAVYAHSENSLPVLRLHAQTVL
jgi:hypothetical protein